MFSLIKKYKNKKRGMGLIEIVIGSAIIVTGILALSDAYSRYVKFAFANESNLQAAYIAEEGLEAITFLRDKGWTTNIKNLSTTTTYYIAWDSTNAYWKATTTTQYIDSKFLRQILITDVKRDGSDHIATTGTYDPNTKFVTVNVLYFQGHGTTTQTMNTYITNLNGD